MNDASFTDWLNYIYQIVFWVSAMPADSCTILHDLSTRAKRRSTNLVETTPSTGKLQWIDSKRSLKVKVDNDDDQKGDSGNGK